MHIITLVNRTMQIIVSEKKGFILKNLVVDLLL